MKKYIRWAIIALIAAVFIGTFVFLYQKSVPKVTRYEINTAQLLDIEKTGESNPCYRRERAVS